MKSIVEQASSIAKAINNAWIRAGKPEEFKVKIFEEEKRNFLGMTTQQAKIGFMFEEKAVPVKTQKPKQQKKVEQSEKPRPQRRGWNDEMISIAEKWVKGTLEQMDISGIKFSTKVQGRNLNIAFKKALFKTEAQQKAVFRNFAYLIMATLRSKFQQGFKDLKVVLKTE